MDIIKLPFRALTRAPSEGVAETTISACMNGAGFAAKERERERERENKLCVLVNVPGVEGDTVVVVVLAAAGAGGALWGVLR